MKKTLSLILALLMSISTASVAFAAEEVAIEEEVAVEEVVAEEEVVESPYVDAVKYLNTYKIYKGNGEDLDTESDVNRWQMALFAARLATGWVEDDKWEDGPQNSSEFTDLAGTYAENVYGAISYVNQMGIIEGYGDGTFGPMKGITYQDALTIVVRTLGYQNLDWPWGYIQKGVELGLTEGVVEVAYTDTLTRGEVAQIIYNALFAETKGGSTLGLDSFGIEFGWEDVVIVSSDRDVFTNTDYAPSSFVGFQLIENGELDGDVYYAKAADLGLEGHDDELAVGSSYEVFFEKDADSELVSIIDYKPNYVETVWNFGKTDDEGVAVEGYAIETLFDTEYKLVSKYSANYLGNAFAAKGEMIVVDALGSIKVIEYTGKSNIGIDMNTGDIVKFATAEDGEITVEKILWHWNEVVEHYYEIVFDKNDEIGINYMDADDEAKLLEEIKKSTKVEVEKNGFAASAAIDEDSAYASLDIYDVNGKAYGIYEEYKFGKFTNSTKKCADCKADKASYKLSAVLTYVNNDNVITKVESDSFNEIVEGACDHTVDAYGHKVNVARAWINPAFAANATEDGYANGYVIYSADKQTGEIKIVKYINDCEDADTYVAKGTIKAYSIADEYVVIGGEKYTFDYDNLEGAEIVFAKQNKASYSDLLRAYFNQYVEYVVVDGEIVDMTIVGGSTTNLFVVEKYAGISSDGYVVVDGYYTDAASDLVRIRVASYNNNYTGDPFYYMTSEKAAAAFTKGSIYTVSSTEEDGSVNAQIVGKVTDNGYKVVNSDYVALKGDIKITTENADDGYLTINNKVVRDKGFTYILIGAEKRDGFAPIAVYSGKVSDAKWWAEGTIIDNDSDVYNNGTYVIVNANWSGFGKDMGTAGLVALLGDYYWSADFDGNDTEDWYLLGAAEYEVEVFDFYTASSIVVSATNLDLEEGYLYRTIDNTLVYDKEISAKALLKELKENYLDTDAQSADYLFGDLVLTAANIGDVETTISKSVSKQLFTSGKEYTDLVGDVKAIKLIDLDGDKIVSITNLNKDVLKALAEDAGVDTVALDGFYIYNNSTSHAYVYAYVDGAATTGSDTDDVYSKNVIEADKDAYIDTIGDVSIKYTDGDITAATLNSLTITFTGAAVENDTHQAVENHSYYFGNAGECDFEDWHCTVDDKAVYGSIVAEVYEEHDTEDICNLIKAVVIDDINLVLTEETQYFTVKFVNNFGTKAEFIIGARFTADEIICGISAVKTGSHYGSFDKVIARPAGLMAK